MSSLTEPDDKKASRVKSYDEETNQILADWVKEQLGKAQKQEEKFSISKDEEVRRQTKVFCEWIDKCGGNPANRLDYETIVNLFASSFESKPTLSVPIKIVQKQDIPIDLKTTSRTNSSKASTSPRDIARSDDTLIKASQPVLENATKRRLNYGAWYLPIEKWDRSKNTGKIYEKLVDSGKSSRQESLDEMLSTLYMTSVFSKFAKEQGKPISRVLKHAQATKKQADIVK
ncbi:FAM47E [Cichlidogyrus casuarinus]|uniref:FAM47E n=1 Tax=Cichlidogyrus casuarinus TaxID=1844966 RepID=A0ABD2Q4P8_9PLAT